MGGERRSPGPGQRSWRRQARSRSREASQLADCKVPAKTDPRWQPTLHQITLPQGLRAERRRGRRHRDRVKARGSCQFAAVTARQNHPAFRPSAQAHPKPEGEHRSRVRQRRGGLADGGSEKAASVMLGQGANGKGGFIAPPAPQRRGARSVKHHWHAPEGPNPHPWLGMPIRALRRHRGDRKN